MKKGFLVLIASAMLSPLAAHADVIVDTVEQREFVNWFGYHEYKHDISKPEYNFTLGSAIGGTLEVLVYDDGGAWDFGEAVLFVVEGFDFDTGGLTFGSAFLGDLEVNALGELNHDGMLNVKVKSLWGDFWVGDSTLTVYTAPTAVPEPSVLMLLGAGMLGLGLSRRRRRS